MAPRPDPVRATTMTRSDSRPLEMNVFWPLRTYSSPSRTAEVRIALQVAARAGLGHRDRR